MSTAQPLLDSQSLSFEVGDRAVCVGVGDLDRDGNIDVVVAVVPNSVTPGWISVMKGDGTGRFVLRSTTPVGRQPVDLTLADFNGDGLLDVAAINQYSASVSLLFGAGDGTLGDRIDIPVPDYPQAICQGDFDRDGKVDLVVSNASTTSPPITLLLGAGDGTFPNRVEFSCAGVPSSLASADLDEDGNPDLVLVYGDVLGTMRGDGVGGLGPCAAGWVGYGPCSIAVGDLNLDHHVDLVTANCQSNNISTVLGRGDGTFGPVSQMDAGGQPSAVAVDDMNGDGFPDWIVTSAGAVTIIFGDGHGASSGRQSLSFGGYSRRVATGRFSGDDRPDIVAAGGSSISIALGDGSSVFRRKLEVPLVGTAVGFAWGNLNGDAFPDFVACFESGNYLRVWLGNGNGTFTLGNPVGGTIGPNDAVLADLDRDGTTDLAFVSWYPSLLSVCHGTGLGTFAARADYPLPSSPLRLATADLNADGTPDIVVVAHDSLRVFLGDGIGGLRTPIAVWAPGANDVKCADIDGDGRIDLVSCNVSNTVSLIRNVGNGSYGPHIDFPVGQAPHAVSVGDCNGDGFPDVVTANSVSNTASVLLSNGAMGLAAAVEYPVGTQPEDVALQDLDGDAHPELITANAGGGVTVMRGSPLGTFYDRWDLAAGFWPSRLAVLDLNGDQNVDVAVLSAGTIPILLNQRAYLGVPLAPDLVGLDLGPIFPNPSRYGISFGMTVAEAASPSIRFMDLAGRVVRKLQVGLWQAGTHFVHWDGRNDQGRRVASGVYFLVLDLNGKRVARRVVLVD